MCLVYKIRQYLSILNGSLLHKSLSFFFFTMSCLWVVKKEKKKFKLGDFLFTFCVDNGSSISSYDEEER